MKPSVYATAAFATGAMQALRAEAGEIRHMGTHCRFRSMAYKPDPMPARLQEILDRQKAARLAAIEADIKELDDYLATI